MKEVFLDIAILAAVSFGGQALCRYMVLHGH
jgi:hypothetical protein